MSQCRYLLQYTSRESVLSVYSIQQFFSHLPYFFVFLFLSLSLDIVNQIQSKEPYSRRVLRPRTEPKSYAEAPDIVLLPAKINGRQQNGNIDSETDDEEMPPIIAIKVSVRNRKRSSVLILEFASHFNCQNRNCQRRRYGSVTEDCENYAKSYGMKRPNWFY